MHKNAGRKQHLQTLVDRIQIVITLQFTLIFIATLSTLCMTPISAVYCPFLAQLVRRIFLFLPR
jgi:hypothetical protein